MANSNKIIENMSGAWLHKPNLMGKMHFKMRNLLGHKFSESVLATLIEVANLDRRVIMQCPRAGWTSSFSPMCNQAQRWLVLFCFVCVCFGMCLLVCFGLLYCITFYDPFPYVSLQSLFWAWHFLQSSTMFCVQIVFLPGPFLSTRSSPNRPMYRNLEQHF